MVSYLKKQTISTAGGLKICRSALHCRVFKLCALNWFYIDGMCMAWTDVVGPSFPTVNCGSVPEVGLAKCKIKGLCLYYLYLYCIVYRFFTDNLVS